MPPTIISIHDAIIRDKMAGFDFDWTLVKPKENRKFPKTVDDWQWLFPSIPDKLRELYREGYMIVIFTNQTKEWKEEQIIQAMLTLNIPVFIAIAFEKKDFKPSVSLYDSLPTSKKGVNIAESFFVGDALGRKDDFSDSDKKFADNLGVKCYAPEEFFPMAETENTGLPKEVLSELSKKHVVIMMGYPGSGKSSIAQEIIQKHEKYHWIQGDEYKTSKAMIKKAKEFIPDSIIFDATNSSKAKRSEYVAFAKQNGYTNIMCIHVATPIEIAYKRNKTRDPSKQVPRIAYSVYTKHYEAPSEEEGFHLVELQ